MSGRPIDEAPLPVPAFVLQAAPARAAAAAFVPPLPAEKGARTALPWALPAGPSAPDGQAGTAMRRPATLRGHANGGATPPAKRGLASTHGARSKALPGDAAHEGPESTPADEAPILNDREGRDVVAGRATIEDNHGRTDFDTSKGSGRPAERLVAVKDAHTVLIPDARTGLPRAVHVGERLPSGATLVSVDPKAGRAHTDRGVLELQ